MDHEPNFDLADLDAYLNEHDAETEAAAAAAVAVTAGNTTIYEADAHSKDDWALLQPLEQDTLIATGETEVLDACATNPWATNTPTPGLGCNGTEAREFATFDDDDTADISLGGQPYHRGWPLDDVFPYDRDKMSNTPINVPITAMNHTRPWHHHSLPPLDPFRNGGLDGAAESTRYIAHAGMMSTPCMLSLPSSRNIAAPLKTPKHNANATNTSKKYASATPIPDVKKKCSKTTPKTQTSKRVRRVVGQVTKSRPVSWELEAIMALVQRIKIDPRAADSEGLVLAQGHSLNPRDFKDIVHALGARVQEVDSPSSARRIQLDLAPAFNPIYKPISKPLLRIGQDLTYVMTSDIPIKERRRYDVFSDLQMGTETAFWCDQGNAHSVLDVSKNVQTLGSDGRHVNPRTIQVAHALASRVSRLLDTEVCVMKCFYYALCTRGPPKKRRKSETAGVRPTTTPPATPTSASRPLGLHKHIYMLCEQSIDDRHKCLPGARVWLVRYFIKGDLDPALAPLIDMAPEATEDVGAKPTVMKRAHSSEATVEMLA
ncbi:Hypothetical Protein FCC1311_051632 [Hondaea fermentalgiana]|uniref:Uncharacterized protein n=1 Tax=Hondaea fermentalgiana TaxID=2315210 RepID=A0A2R5GDB3_9STRA|nr:Hypothetical Protein FCC1311_051632 [Hondaea fermentalgiana]|eukprot:GBG28942.1 Hypothetical Protein FCC1311_051632 [Hondaea fermentalgiana]